MPERIDPAGIDERRLDALLSEAAATVAYPATPALQGRVVSALAAEAGGVRRRPLASGAVPPWAYAAVVVLALATAIALVFPGPRQAVADFFGFVPGQRIEVLPSSDETPSPAPTETRTPHPPAVVGTLPAPEPTPTPAARPISPALIELAMGYEVALPDATGEPEALYVVQYGDQPLLIAQYAEFDLWQTRGSGFFGKSVPEGTLEQPTVHDSDAFWIAPGGHETAFVDEDGNEVRGSRRTVEDYVLIWYSADTYYRLETALSLEEALAVAETLP